MSLMSPALAGKFLITSTHLGMVTGIQIYQIYTPDISDFEECYIYEAFITHTYTDEI